MLARPFARTHIHTHTARIRTDPIRTSITFTLFLTTSKKVLSAECIFACFSVRSLNCLCPVLCLTNHHRHRILPKENSSSTKLSAPTKVSLRTQNVFVVAILYPRFSNKSSTNFDLHTHARSHLNFKFQFVVLMCRIVPRF